MSKALIVYTSMTGNTKTCAHIVEDKLKELGVRVTVKDCTQAGADEFMDVDICIVGTYTYGDYGNLPNEMVNFYEDLASLKLKGKVFGVFGSGDSYYPQFCKAVDDFTDQFIKTGATVGADCVKVDLSPNMEDLANLHAFAKSLDWWQKRMVV
ncbi:flavodoxin [Bacillus tuaregi]|uniref:flavodoxin n=1 Tax=Bacillus tuaregi TaxID=1816695 RepID=UPI0008F8BF7F|nr:flavodoxin [Bacillus tuaregi]